jgi:hypothetical protein
VTKRIHFDGVGLAVDRDKKVSVGFLSVFFSIQNIMKKPNRRQKPDTESYIYIQNKMLYSENHIIF